MASFECCHKCKPPKRTPGCHDHCPEYKAVREAYDAKKVEIDRQHRLAYNLNTQAHQAVRKASRKKHTRGGSA